MIKVFWAITICATTLAAVFLSQAVLAPGISAPQQGASAATACALVVVPYVFTRACEGIAGVGARTAAGHIPVFATTGVDAGAGKKAGAEPRGADLM